MPGRVEGASWESLSLLLPCAVSACGRSRRESACSQEPLVLLKGIFALSRAACPQLQTVVLCQRGVFVPPPLVEERAGSRHVCCEPAALPGAVGSGGADVCPGGCWFLFEERNHPRQMVQSLLSSVQPSCCLGRWDLKPVCLSS